MHEAFAAHLPGVAIKWPNDLIVAKAKLAGALLERRGDAVIVGVGVNLAHAPALPDRATTSLAAATGLAPDPEAVLRSLAEAFAKRLSIWRREPLAATIAAWSERAHPCGTALSATLPDGDSRKGRFDGLDATGALRLRLPDGAVEVIHAADVFLGME